jgi:hypothetical protein
MPRKRFYAAVLATFFVPAAAHATKPKLDDDTCAQLRLEQTKLIKSGILNEMGKGPEWAKANLPAGRLSEIKHYIELDEQVRFGCRDAKLSADAKKASEAAARIEINSDADPTAPTVKDPAKPGTKAEAKTKRPSHKHSSHKKSKKNARKSGSLDPAKETTNSIPSTTAPAQSVAVGSGESGSSEPASSSASSPTLPAFGFGETVVVPQGAP